MGRLAKWFLAFFSRLDASARPSPAAERVMRAGKPARELDPMMLFSAVALLMLGLIMVYSASIATAEGGKYTNYNQYFFLIRHTIFLFVGLTAGLLAFQIPVRTWQAYAPWLFMLCAILLVIVLVPGIGKSVNGARRWIGLGPFNIQPSEFMKVCAGIYAADYAVRKQAVMGSFTRGFLPLAVVILSVGFLLLQEPDFGAFVVVCVIAFGVLFLGGVDARVFALLAIVAIVGFATLIWISPYRRERLLGFMDPWQDAFGKGYQLSHSLIAFGRGQIWGVGLGGSVEKLFYLPEAHTDFLLAVIAEELGLVGVMFVIIMFAMLVQRCFAIAREAIYLERYFAGLVAQGFGLWFGVQSFINMGVNAGLLPTKGLTLPLMSFGGSGIVANCLALGILFRIDWEIRQMKRGMTP